jgi:WD40 repeat protein
VSGPVSKVAWSPDGILLATTPGDPHGVDHTATLWTAAGRPVATLSGHTGVVHCAAWSPDSKLLATASADGSVRLWDRLGRLVRSLPGTDPVFGLAWSPDGSILAAGAISFAGQLQGVITLWHSTGTLMRSLGTSFTGGKFLNLAWSPDSLLLAAGASDYVDWHLDGSQVAILRQGGTPAWAMAWSADSTTVAIGDENGSLAIVDTTGSIVGAAQFPSDVNALSSVPDGSGLIVGLNGKVELTHPLDPQNPAHAIWSADTADDGHVAWSPDGHRLAIAVTDGLAILSEDGSAVAALTGCPGDPVAFAWTGTNLAAATASGSLCAWQAP